MDVETGGGTPLVKKHIPSILDKLVKNREESRYARMIYVAMILLFILGAVYSGCR